MAGGIALASVGFATLAQSRIISPSPEWAQALPAAPVAGAKITQEYAALVGRDAYFWAWPLVNVYIRRLVHEKVSDTTISGAVPEAPLNRLGMLSDYLAAEQRLNPCPNQDVVYGVGSLALDLSPVVIQVPDFGDRFWVYQAVDLRTDSFAELGKMYGTTPGFYLFVGPNWKGEVPKGITKIFRASTNTGYVMPRVFQDDSPEDNKAVQSVSQEIMMYPLTEYDGKMKSRNWTKLRHVLSVTGGEDEVKLIVPERFFDILPLALADAAPMPGEESRYAEVGAVLAAAEKDARIRAALTRAALEADTGLVAPLLEFRNFGLQLPRYWSTHSNGADFGTDYFTRTAVAKSNIFVNKPNEAQYFYQDLDDSAQRLNGAKRYTMTFVQDKTPSVRGFWSLTLYNHHLCFMQMVLGRDSVGAISRAFKRHRVSSVTS